jgi:transposase-like protein
MPIKPEHLDKLLAGYENPEDLLGEGGLFKQLKKALLERALGAELTHHLGYEKGDAAGRGSDRRPFNWAFRIRFSSSQILIP